MRAPSSAQLASCCVALLSAVALVGCSPHTAPPVPANTTSGPSPTSAASSPSSSSSGALKEPATTNTLPPPPPPTRPAPSTADGLSARSLPVPAGWRTAALPGSDEEGFQGKRHMGACPRSPLRRAGCDYPRMQLGDARRLHRSIGGARGQLQESLPAIVALVWCWNFPTIKLPPHTSISTESRSRPAPEKTNRYALRS